MSRYTGNLTVFRLLSTFLLGNLFATFKVWHVGGLDAGYRRVIHDDWFKSALIPIV